MNFQNYKIGDFLCDESFLHYCSGQNAEDVKLWEIWLLNNPDKRKIVKEAQAFYIQLKEELVLRKQTQSDLENFKTLFLKHTQSPEFRKEGEISKSWLIISKMNLSLALAASLIFVLGFVFYSNYQQKSFERKPFALVRTNPQNSTKQIITLPDGSLVTLNPNSRIELDKNFNKNFRIVKLVGEAFFEVAKNHRKPFIVKAGNIATTAVGTSFMVRYYPHESRVKVSLLTGKVKVEQLNLPVDIRTAVYLTPGLEVVIDKKSPTDILEKKPFKSDHIKEWKLDHLSFKDAEFNEIISTLEDWFGVKIKVVNAPEITKHFTGDFKNQNLSNVLEALSFAHKFEYQIKPELITIQFKPSLNKSIGN